MVNQGSGAQSRKRPLSTNGKSGLTKAKLKKQDGVAFNKGAIDAFLVPRPRGGSKTSRPSSPAQCVPPTLSPIDVSTIPDNLNLIDNSSTRASQVSPDWLVRRLNDGQGQADAQASWDARSKERLTATDVTLINKRRAMGCQSKKRSGWRVQGDTKVFVAYTGAGVQVAEGAEAFRLSMAYGKKRDKRKKDGKDAVNEKTADRSRGHKTSQCGALER